MEYTQLEHFRAAAKHGNLSRAAEELYVTESALSKSIKKLEGELGVELFDRTRNRLSLNETGAEILPFVEASLSELEKIRRVTERRRDSMRTLRFAFTDSSVMQMVLPRIMGACSEFNFEELLLREDAVEAALLEGKCDLALSFTQPTELSLMWIPVYEDRPMIIAPPTHKYYERESISLKELDRQDVLLMKDSGYLTGYINRRFEQEGIRLRPHFQVDQALCYQKMKTTRYLTFISLAYLPNVDLGRSRAIPFENKELIVTCYLSCRKKKMHALLPVIHEIERYYHLLLGE